MNPLQQLMNFYTSHGASVQSYLTSDFILTWTLVGMFVYFLPSLIATYRGHQQAFGIFVLNLITAPTVVGWLGSFYWALSNVGNLRRNIAFSPVHTDLGNSSVPVTPSKPLIRSNIGENLNTRDTLTTAGINPERQVSRQSNFTDI